MGWCRSMYWMWAKKPLVADLVEPVNDCVAQRGRRLTADHRGVEAALEAAVQEWVGGEQSGGEVLPVENVSEGLDVGVELEWGGAVEVAHLPPELRAVLGGVQRREDRRGRRYRPGRLGHDVEEPHALRGEAVDNRRRVARIAVAAEVVGAQRIDHDDQHVAGLPRLWHLIRLRGHEGWGVATTANKSAAGGDEQPHWQKVEQQLTGDVGVGTAERCLVRQHGGMIQERVEWGAPGIAGRDLMPVPGPGTTSLTFVRSAGRSVRGGPGGTLDDTQGPEEPHHEPVLQLGDP
jgi:hypothetical protein